MRKWSIGLVGSCILGGSIMAHAELPRKPVYGHVTFHLAKEQWVKTQEARVTISINATAPQAQLATIRSDLNKNLQRIAKAKWHFTQFTRRRDGSGLERIMAVAEARLPESMLANLFSGAENVSKPGAKYTVSSVAFKPNLAEVEAVKTQLRHKIYEEVNSEIAKLNAQSPHQPYFVSRIAFSTGARPVPRSVEFSTAMKLRDASRLRSRSGGAHVTISQKMKMHALVDLTAKIPSHHRKPCQKQRQLN